MRRRNREGVFNNAVYSKIVKAAEDTEVLLGVEEDLDFIIRQNPFEQSSRMWNHAPAPPNRGSTSRDEEDPPKVQIKQPGRGLHMLKRKNDMLVTKTIKPTKRTRVEDLEVVSPESPSQPYFPPIRRHDLINREQVMAIPSKTVPTMVSRDRGPSLFNSTPKNVVPISKKIPSFPSDLPMDNIAARATQSMPKLPLRVGHSQTYQTLVSDLCKKSLMSRESSKDQTNVRLMTTVNETFFQAGREHSALLKQTIQQPFPMASGVESPLGKQFESRKPKPVDNASILFGDSSILSQTEPERPGINLQPSPFASPSPSTFQFYGISEPVKSVSAASNSSSGLGGIKFLDADFYG